VTRRTPVAGVSGEATSSVKSNVPVAPVGDQYEIVTLPAPVPAPVEFAIHRAVVPPFSVENVALFPGAVTL
jgi:hypothetical protein